MSDVVAIWGQALPTIQNSISGRGVWAALNAARPIALDEGIFVIGLPHEDGELAGHLRLPQTNRIIETIVSRVRNSPTRVVIIDGITQQDLEIYRRREAERRRLQEQGMAKMRAEMQARTSWDQVYDQLSRRYSAVSNKSLPQNRARFLDEALSIIVEARQEMQNHDDMSERSFARCLERVAQYCEVPSTLVAMQVLQRAGEM